MEPLQIIDSNDCTELKVYLLGKQKNRLEPYSPNWNHELDYCNTNYIWTGAIAKSIRGGSNSLAATAAMLIVIFATKISLRNCPPLQGYIIEWDPFIWSHPPPKIIWYRLQATAVTHSLLLLASNKWKLPWCVSNVNREACHIKSRCKEIKIPIDLLPGKEMMYLSCALA